MATLIPVTFSTVSGSVLALAVHLKVHKHITRFLKKCGNRLFKKNKDDIYCMKSKLTRQTIFPSVEKRRRVHSCQLSQHRRNCNHVDDTQTHIGICKNQVAENQEWMRRNHSLYTYAQPIIRTDQRETVKTQSFENRLQDQVIDSQVATRQEQTKLIQINISIKSDPVQAINIKVSKSGLETASREPTESEQNAVLDPQVVKRPEQEQVIKVKEPAENYRDHAMDSQVPLRLEDPIDQFSDYLQPLEVETSGDTDSISTLMAKICNELMEEKSNYLTSDQQESTNKHFSTNSHPFLEENCVSSSENVMSFDEVPDLSLVSNLNQSQVEINNSLAVQLYFLFAEGQKGNILFSPFSISIINSILFFDDLITDYIFGTRKSISSLISHFSTLQFVNAILAQKGFKGNQEFSRMLVDIYKTLLLENDFLSENKQAVTFINEWVSERTNGMIPKIIDSIDSSTVVYNAAYFKATWMHQFDKQQTFVHTFHDSTHTIDMMHGTECFPYYEDESLQVLELPFNEDETAMMIFLPRKRGGLELFEALLTPSFLQEMKIKLLKTRVDVALPRFDLEYSITLAPNLRHSIFYFTSENDSGFASASSNLAASSILHKTVLKISENGCNSPANLGSKSEMDYCFDVNPKFIADHPFAFVIYDRRSDIILLVGRINCLKKMGKQNSWGMISVIQK